MVNLVLFYPANNLRLKDMQCTVVKYKEMQLNGTFKKLEAAY